MKQVWIRKNGKAETLRIEEKADYTNDLQENQVLIDVHYSGINFADIIMRLGLYKDAPKKPYVPGYEVSGIIQAIGPGVKDFEVGDQVISGSLFGGYSSQIVVEQDLVFKLPKHLSLEQGAALPVSLITVNAALVDMGRIRKGDRVLIDCATGGIGIIALQLCQKVGAETIGLTSSPDKLSLIESYGAKGLTHDQFWASEKNNQFDFILNSEGGRSVRKHYDRLSSTGRVVAFGMSAAIKDGVRSYRKALKTILSMPWFSLVSMFDRNRGVFALNALKLLEDPHYKKGLAAKIKNSEELEITPLVGGVFKAEDVAKAHRFLEAKKAKGKVLLSWK
ncbi:MAG: alcohol dehydrogenase catalytic domain-containing protein [Halobacteriovoraceae bacterium]|jgi:synaptic vesicle membrane protein VAT-1|nr:alcohol dehydrogenase catalytic domain-containing protein [Halobacteriovoraceae bacterium]MBT5094022.1 alcohol dehydrogenase catalytic domain-containing protein [Halobacteriovoraceae bacterium]